MLDLASEPTVDPEPQPGTEPEADPEADLEPERRPRLIRHDDDAPARRGGSRRPVPILVVLIVLLAGVLGAQAYYLWGQPEPVISSARPVLVDGVDARAVVEQAAEAATSIINASAETDEAEVDAATERMTAPFAEQFRSTKEDVREEFVAAQTQVTADISAQGVVSASEQQVVAMLFLTQNTTRAGQDLTVVQFRVEVTMVRTEEGWLVSDLQTV